MITLHRSRDAAWCDAIEDRLKDMVLAYRIDPAGENDEFSVAFITEGTRSYRGPEQIESFLNEVEAEAGFSRQISADACYLDPDDPSRCI